ncbi:sugar phosphate isomerase/epimerase [Streptomyces triticagri]|uniref:Sugar phosphate isomerase/epimerase n=1 Tax=Streptomyces triticagri TaxID=2293568 RepID=A0A372LYY3_9ACTN|nr:sugar phosphate isomerase/epimerase family protein [Streptomyces triticagri]RFU83896.1 sugar phosphate isomerase/epimerase [Streptomyces triticagri]
MRFSCADYTWPLLPHGAALDLARALECAAVDLGFMTLRSHIRPETARGAIPFTAGVVRERLDARGLDAADVFAIPYTDFETMAANHPDPKEQENSLAFFRDAVDFAAGTGAPGLTTLPGVLFAGDSHASALARAADGLSRRVELAAAHGLDLSVEPHTGSLIDTPEKTLELLERVPGLRITLDPAHYVHAAVPVPDILPLLPHARHLQCRPGAPGRLQVAVEEDTIDWPSLVTPLRRQGYEGYWGLEFVWQEWMDCNRVDTVAESALLRDALRAAGAIDRGTPVGAQA